MIFELRENWPNPWMLVTVLCTISFSGRAQIKWSWSVPESGLTSNGSTTVLFHAILSDGWYLYGNQFDRDCGPLPTEITFSKPNNFQTVGDLEAVGQVPFYDEIFDCQVNIFRSKAEFRQNIKAAEGYLQMGGVIEGQVCNNEQGRCMPFAQEFSFDRVYLKDLKPVTHANSAQPLKPASAVPTTMEDPVPLAIDILSKTKELWAPANYLTILGIYTIGKTVTQYGGGYIILQSPTLALEMCQAGFFEIGKTIGQDLALEIFEDLINSPRNACIRLSDEVIGEGLRDFKIAHEVALTYYKTNVLSREAAVRFLKHRWGLHKMALARELYNRSVRSNNSTHDILNDQLLTEIQKMTQDIRLRAALSQIEWALVLGDFVKVLEQKQVGLMKNEPYLLFRDKITEMNEFMLAEAKRVGYYDEFHPVAIAEARATIPDSRPGPLRFDLTFTEWPSMDIDLHVQDPLGYVINYARKSQNGGKLLEDCRCGSCPEQGREIVEWSMNAAPSKGTYYYWVNVYGNCGGNQYKSEYTINVWVGGKQVSSQKGAIVTGVGEKFFIRLE